MTPRKADRDAALADLLAGSISHAAVETVWGDGSIPLRITAHLGEVTILDELVTSVRCIVTVGDGVVMCADVDGHLGDAR